MCSQVNIFNVVSQSMAKYNTFCGKKAKETSKELFIAEAKVKG